MKVILCSLLMILILLFTEEGWSQETNPFGKVSLGIEVGSWKPNNLSTDASVSPFGLEGASPYVGIFVLSPWLSSFTFRATLGFWSQGKIAALADIESVTLLPVMLDLKYQLAAPSRLSPYVSYGVAAYFGSENKVKGLQAELRRHTEMGLGVNFGAGIDLLLARHWGLGAEFRYHYAKFSKKLGLTDDYSGPKLSAGVYYLF